MSIKAINWAWNMELNSTVKIVLLALANWADEDNKCWPGIESLKKRCGLSRRAVINSINALVKYGLIIRQSRYKNEAGRTSNMYILDTEIEGLCARDALRGLCARDGGLSAPGAHSISARGAPYTKETNNTHLEKHQKEKENSVKEKEKLANNKLFKYYAEQIILFLNEQSGRHFKFIDSSIDSIIMRMKEVIKHCDATIIESANSVCGVIEFMRMEWGTDAHMKKCLRTTTLFRKANFWDYFGQAPEEMLKYEYFNATEKQV